MRFPRRSAQLSTKRKRPVFALSYIQLAVAALIVCVLSEKFSGVLPGGAVGDLEEELAGRDIDCCIFGFAYVELQHFRIGAVYQCDKAVVICVVLKCQGAGSGLVFAVQHFTVGRPRGFVEVGFNRLCCNFSLRLK